MDTLTHPEPVSQSLAPHLDDAEAATGEPKHHEYKRQVSRKQLIYILVRQGPGPAVIAALVNFGVASAMYRTTKKEIRLWPLKENTIAGDMGVTVIIQSIVTTLIASILIHTAVRKKQIEPLSFPWPDVAWWHKSGRKSIWKRYIGKILAFLSPTDTLSFRLSRREFMASLGTILLRGFLISAIFFPLMWPIAIAITDPLYGRIDMRKTWKPEIIKAIFGGLLALFMHPFLAVLVLGCYASPKYLSGVTNMTLTSMAAVPITSTTKPIVKPEQATAAVKH